MKLDGRFRSFLEKTVNLNQSRIDTLNSRVATIKGVIRGSEYEPRIRRFSEQGSWAHKTIIKPPGSNTEFDADLVVYIDEVVEWEARDYILSLRAVFRSNLTYRDITSIKSRCVTIDYAGDFHLDIVPIVVIKTDKDIDTYWVCNRNDNAFEQTDGDGFARWWRGQNTIVGGNDLIKATRLLKYLRDSKGTFSAKSILLTTLIGEQIEAPETADAFNGTSTSLKTIVDRIDDWLQARPNLPLIENPAFKGEYFTRNWDQAKYDNFRNRIHSYREWIDDAYEEEDRDESIAKWRRVFGDDFAKATTVKRAKEAVTEIASTVSPGQDLVSVVINFGKQVLSDIPKWLPHVAIPTEPENVRFEVLVRAKERRTKGGAVVRTLADGDSIGKNSGVEFQALQQNGLPLPKETYMVKWQVVNTDVEAADVNELRGEFYNSDIHGFRYESTKYRGVHWVQAHVVNKRTGMINGKSERFFVVVE